MAAVDFSEYSKATLKFAAFLASSVQVPLVVANVINHRDVEAIRAVEDENLGLSVENVFRRCPVPILSVRGKEHETIACSRAF
jgi:hypothetical protein